MKVNRNNKANSLIAIKWLVFVFVLLFAIPSFAQDNKPVNNRRKIKENKAKSQTTKEKAKTRDISGRKLRTKNTNSVAGRAVYSSSSPYTEARTEKDRVGKAIGGRPIRERSRSSEASRNNIFPQSGAFVNSSSGNRESGKAIKSLYGRSTKSLTTKRITTSGGSVRTPRSKSRSAESSRSNVYPQKGPFVHKLSTKQKGTGTVKSVRSKSSKVSTNTERIARGTAKYTRTGKLSAGPVPPGKKKKQVTPRSATQQFVTRGKKNVYWGKFSKGERAITTDVAGNPVRRRNYRTPANEIIQAKNPYEGRKQVKGDRAYSGTFKSGHTSASRKTENAWKGSLAGGSLRKRAERNNQIAGQRVGPSRRLSTFSAKLSSTLDTRRGIKPVKNGGGSASGKYQSNKAIGPRAPGIGAAAILRGQNRVTGIRPGKGGGGSISGKLRSNKPIGARPPGMGASAMLKGQSRVGGIRPKLTGGGSISGKLRSNKPIGYLPPGIGANAMSRGQKKITGVRPEKGGGGSVTGKYKSNTPIAPRAPGIGASSILVNLKKMGKGVPKQIQQGGLNAYRNSGAERAKKGKLLSGAKMWNNNNRPLASIDYGSARISRFQGKGKGREPKKGGGSVSGKFRSNDPLMARAPGIGASSIEKNLNKLGRSKPKELLQGGLVAYRNSGAERAKKGKLLINGKVWNNDNRPLASIDYGTAKVSGFQGKQKTRQPKKGGGSVSGKMWNNKGEPIIVRTPAHADAGEVNYSGKTKLPLLRRSYVRNPNASELALKKQTPMETVYMADGLQTKVKERKTGTKPNAVKGSMPGLSPSKATVKASDYTRVMKAYWQLKHNPSSAKLALKVVAPGKAYARITDYQGNLKMKKYHDKKQMPDAPFAHLKKNNVKGERTIGMDIKLLWAKIFKKNGTQPPAVKEKVHRPRYDKREKELWPGLYD